MKQTLGPATLHCPACGSPMKLRANLGGSSFFYGCVRFPDCAGVVPARGDGAPRRFRPQDGDVARERIAAAKDAAVARLVVLRGLGRMRRLEFLLALGQVLDADTLLDVGEVRHAMQ